MRRLKKKIALFVSFIIVFAAALLVIYIFASPGNTVEVEHITDSILVRQIETTSGTYLGEAFSSVFQGFGEFEFLTGEKYVGSWDNSKMTGDGTLEFPGIGRYNGSFLNNMRSGSGVFIWDDGDIYDGEWANDAMNGVGTYTFRDGSVITGSFKMNALANGRYVFEQDEADGNDDAILYWSIGISDNMLTDPLEFRTSSGLIFVGDCPKPDTIIQAQVTYPDGSVYVGNLINGIRTGEGVYTWAVGDKYDGDWENDAMSGVGAYTFSSGNLYVGTLADGVRSGAGVFTWYSNDLIVASYNGEWSNDIMCGNGNYFYSSSDYPKLSGVFENGIPTGTCIYYQNTTFSFETVWVDGSCISVRER